MLSIRDQENLVHGHQQAAAAKPLNQGTRGLQPKTPGNKYPKTPLKIPLNDENAATGMGKTGKGKGLGGLASGKQIAFDKNAFVTPMGPRNRAPLGMKTTNAKTKAFQTPGPVQDKEIEKTQKPLTSTRKPKRLIHADTVKLEVHGDESPLVERDVEYCPPKPKDLPYESDVFPDGCLDYSVLKPGNLMRGVFGKRDLEVDGNGLTRMDREAEAAYQKAAKAGDEAILAMVEEEWTMGDAPETFRHIRKKPSGEQQKPALANSTKKSSALQSKGPATINSRRAASALAVAPKSSLVAPRMSKPAPKPSLFARPKAIMPTNVPIASTMRATAAVARSRSTIGHTKGRSVSGLMQSQNPAPMKTARSGLTRSVSTMSTASDATITPARFARKHTEKDYESPAFMRAFDVEDDELDLHSGLAECLRREEEEEEEFIMPLPTDL